MWKMLNRFLHPKPRPTYHRAVSFLIPSKGHWAEVLNGDNLDMVFRIRGLLAKGDDILVRMESDRVGRYQVFNLHPDPLGVGDYIVHAFFIGYENRAYCGQKAPSPTPVVKGLLGDGSRGVQSDESEFPLVQIVPAATSGKLWEILARQDARNARQHSLRAASNFGFRW